jgi:hypothetical protein
MCPMGDDNQDNPYKLTGPSYRLTGENARGTGRARTAEARPALDVRRWGSKESLADVAGRAARSGAPGKSPAAATARVCIFDLDGSIHGEQATIAALLEGHLATLGDQAAPVVRDVLRGKGISFRVVFADGEPAAAIKKGFLPLDYPIYVLSDQTRPRNDFERLRRLMDEHLIPSTIVGAPIATRDQIEDSWTKASLHGVAVPPGFGRKAYRKMAFLKGRTIAKTTRDPRFVANVVLHELGHMHNLFRADAHPRDGSVMGSRRDRRAMEAALLNYNEAHATQIVAEIGRLWALQQLL